MTVLMAGMIDGLTVEDAAMAGADGHDSLMSGMNGMSGIAGMSGMAGMSDGELVWGIAEGHK